MHPLHDPEVMDCDCPDCFLRNLGIVPVHPCDLSGDELRDPDEGPPDDDYAAYLAGWGPTTKED